jgi:hypothetical protein
MLKGKPQHRWQLEMLSLDPARFEMPYTWCLVNMTTLYPREMSSVTMAPR